MYLISASQTGEGYSQHAAELGEKNKKQFFNNYIRNKNQTNKFQVGNRNQEIKRILSRVAFQYLTFKENFRLFAFFISLFRIFPAKTIFYYA